MKLKAFTLIELLVVIAILGILASLLLPAIANVRERGRQVQCRNNLKELHAAAMSYVGDGGQLPYATTYQEYIPKKKIWVERRGWVGPRGPFVAGTAGNVDMWDGSPEKGTLCITNGTLYKYITDKRVYVCPTFVLEAKKIKATNTYVRSYVMNWRLNQANIYSLTKGSRTLLFTELNARKVTNSATTFCVFDTLPANSSSIATNEANTLWYLPTATDGALHCQTSNSPPKEPIANYHNEQGNAVFADGHIEIVAYSNTWKHTVGGM